MLIGKRISGRYKLEKHIGGGGMSNVYQAHDMILDRDVAIKILRYDFSSEEDMHRRFQREALSVTSLTHDNIVTIYDVGEDGDIHYIVMEHVKGKTLKEYIAEHAPVSPAKAVQIMKQLLSAIEHAHDHHIIHRDIKPQNILLDEEGNVKVTDFGIAMALSATSFTQTNSVLGTVHYLSPEQARGGTATRKSDIYALGIVLFELLTGQLPFKGESAVSIALKHLQAETPSVRAINPAIPQSLENVVLRATAKKPEDRYASVKEMHEHLVQSLHPERMNEEKYMPSVDDDATKVMPVIKQPIPVDSLAETRKLTDTPEPQEKPKKKKKKTGLIIASILGALLLIALIVVVAFPGLFKPDKVAVPDVTNMTVEEATEELEANGFIVGEVREDFSDEVEQDRIIRTTPEAGRMRDLETEITLYVSQGPELVEMNDYVGRSVEQVRPLVSDQFKSLTENEEFSEQPAGTILAQQPEAGEEVNPVETDLVLTISKGPDLQQVQDLRGYNKRALDAYEESSGFVINSSTKENSSEVPAGEVIRQDPAAGTRLEPGSTITVVLSSGPKAAATKLYVVSVEIPYEEPEEGQEPEPKNVKIFVQDKTRTLAEPIEEFEITETVSRRLQLEIEEGMQGAYRIEIDNVVVEQETIDYKELP
ncbi:serine/threonine protein kinase [Chryseomicrobium excrementi]|uniref:Serine/threonine-protein kinase PrkC n=1 Tax=Chryseomicrobium excrementi TaxID=2041346 RepID=A0A2M9F399_9BACL|nr:Stk1 family PASTA domain-containing Ser/Thr kinase [Chryseomicrobium excrementi]PJK17914.1 serine/threonine protein kinase [Chryseomicrobium excrementi]